MLARWCGVSRFSASAHRHIAGALVGRHIAGALLSCSRVAYWSVDASALAGALVRCVGASERQRVSASAHWHTGSRACVCVGVWVRVHRRGNLSLGAKNNDRVRGGNSRGVEARPRCGVSRNQGDLP